MSENENKPNLNTWVGIGGAACSIILGIFLAGIYYGSIKDLPAQVDGVRKEFRTQFEALSAQITDLSGRGDKQDWKIQSLNEKVAGVESRVAANVLDNNRQWDELRATQSEAKGALSREQFIQWKSELERKNINITSPPIPQQ